MYFVVIVHLKNVGRIRIEKVRTNSRLYQNENQTHAKESRLKMCHLYMYKELANSRKNNYCRIFMLRAVLGFLLFGLNPDLSWPKSQYRLLELRLDMLKSICLRDLHFMETRSFHQTFPTWPKLSQADIS